jgi:hypothetical protein
LTTGRARQIEGELQRRSLLKRKDFGPAPCSGPVLLIWGWGKEVALTTIYFKTFSKAGSVDFMTR